VKLPSAFQALRRALYGGLCYDEERFTEAYRRHLEGVRSHFAGRACLLHLDICAGEGWSELCAFLGAAVPDVAFPHRNSRREATVGGSHDRV